MAGIPSQCNVECLVEAITRPRSGDACCPDGANANNDNDCKPYCGNGVVETGERCDGDCPTSCKSADPCTSAIWENQEGDCNYWCRYEPVTTYFSGDGCCPPGGDRVKDTDCL
jgi:hypothetical protein